MSQLSFHRKLFSYSIRNMHTKSPKKINPSLPHPFSSPTDRDRNVVRVRTMPKKTKTSIMKLQQQHRQYEKMIDEIMRRHVQQEKLPFSLPKLSVRHIYHNYRVVDLENSNINNSKQQDLGDKLRHINEIRQSSTKLDKKSKRRLDRLQKSTRSKSHDLPSLNLSRSAEKGKDVNKCSLRINLSPAGRQTSRYRTQN